MSKLSSKGPVQRWFCICASALLVLALAACGSSGSSSGGKYQNGKLTSAWVISSTPLVINSASVNAEIIVIPIMPADDYIIADGSGHITESSFYDSPTGTYHVKADGSFAIMVNGVTYEGTLDTPTTGTITSPYSGALTAISNTSGCNYSQMALNLSEGVGLVVDIDANGAVTQNATYPGDFVVTGGHIFCGNDLSLGAVTTDDTGAHKKVRIFGTSVSPPTVLGNYDDDASHSGAAVGTFLLNPLIL